MNFKKYFLPKGWTEKKISEDSFLFEIPEEQIESWKLKRWKKDKVEELINKDGFHMKTEGRSGTIYFVEEKKLCEIYYEISGVKEFDILIFFDQLTEWQLPNKKVMVKKEMEKIQEKLILWLKEKRIKSDL